ncbi:MAG: NAD(P)H-dependent glycerol-3-phosphate dehydrogenase [Terriglobales bacterium]
MSAMSRQRLAVIGGGSWGTALAVVLGAQRPVRLWVREPEIAASIASCRENPVFLPGVTIPEHVTCSTDLAVTVADAQIVLTVMPSHVCRPVMMALRPHLPPDAIVVSATKGLEDTTLFRMTEVIEAVLGASTPLAVLSGPSFAREVARGDPTALVIAARDLGVAHHLQGELSGPSFRLYTSQDVAGVELAAALKNVIAIAAGICDGLGLGSNSIAALIARGLAEMTRLVCACGGRPETLAGLAGLGDLVLTCTGGLSRNRTVGAGLGQGRKLPEILGEMKMVAEGVKTTSAAIALAQRHGVELPIAAQMQRVLFEGLDPRAALRELMERTLKAE